MQGLVKVVLPLHNHELSQPLGCFTVLLSLQISKENIAQNTEFSLGGEEGSLGIEPDKRAEEWT